MKFHGAFEALPRFDELLLVQLSASQTVVSLGTRWIVSQSKQERCCGLIEIATLEKDGPRGEIIATELKRCGCAWKRQSLR